MVLFSDLYVKRAKPIESLDWHLGQMSLRDRRGLSFVQQKDRLALRCHYFDCSVLKRKVLHEN